MDKWHLTRSTITNVAIDMITEWPNMDAIQSVCCNYHFLRAYYIFAELIDL